MANKLASMTDLMNTFLDKILSSCYNINEDFRLPSKYRNGQVFTIASIAVDIGGRPGVKQNINVQNIVSDSILNPVSRSEIEQQVRDFLSSRGITTKVNAIVTTKSMMNFFNNLAIFFARKVVKVTYPDNKSFLIYNKFSSVDSVRLVAKGTESSIEDQINDHVNKVECQQSVEDMLKAINLSSNEKSVAAGSEMFICSSCSSSCSCSSSSSSCSSSSSSYIVYMIV